MRLIYTLFIFVILGSTLNAQNLSGVWRGTFEKNNLNPMMGQFSQDSYKYEVQINDKQDGSIEGVTYSYHTTTFYGKASLKGRWDKSKKILTIKETLLIEVKTTGKTEPCLMTCYLDYRKDGKLETLIGTYSSVVMNTNKDCGDGIVYLERVEESDFEKESFLGSDNKKNKIDVPRKLPSGKNFEADRIAEAKKNDSIKRLVPKQKPLLAQTKNKITPKIAETKKPIAKVVQPQNKQANKPSNNSQIKNKKNNTNTPKTQPLYTNKSTDTTKKDSSLIALPEVKKEIKQEQPQAKIISPPTAEVLTDRENKLVNKIYVDTRDITIEFYDNGEVDNDTISVYKDNKLVINRGRLSTSPITLNLKFDAVNTFYELITVAENLGDIPPNTALMVINYGRKREEVFLTSDEKRNAKVIIEYKGK